MSGQTIGQQGHNTTTVREKGYFEFNPSTWMAKIVSSDLNTPGLENLAKKVGAMIGYIIALLCTGGLFFALDFALNGQPAVIKKEEAKVTFCKNQIIEDEEFIKTMNEEEQKPIRERERDIHLMLSVRVGRFGWRDIANISSKRRAKKLEDAQTRLLEARELLAEACPAKKRSCR